MYETFYGLKERAFNLTPDPEFLFLTNRSKEALSQILYGIERREGFALIVGDVGTGKTTLCWALLEKLEDKNVRTALIQNPMLSEMDILRSILQDLGVRPSAAPHDPVLEDLAQSPAAVFDSSWMERMTKKELLDRLNLFLAERGAEDAFSVLIIDESQNLSQEMLEQLRLLSNLETSKRKLLQIIFVGQLELKRKLELPGLRQLNQRISTRFETKAFSDEETQRYILHRLTIAGGATKLHFTRRALRAIHRHSKGYPRLINLICDRALLAGYSERSLTITGEMVKKAVSALVAVEDVSPRWVPRWLYRMFSVVASAIFFLSILLLLTSKRIVAINVAEVPTLESKAQPRETKVQLQESDVRGPTSNVV